MKTLRYWAAPILLFTVASIIPLAWGYYDSVRRARERQVAYGACISHHDLAGCEPMRPPVVAASTLLMCEMRFLPRECASLRASR
jgi:hypothetical protein